MPMPDDASRVPYRKVSICVWTDEKFCDLDSDDARVVFLLLLIHPRINRLGLISGNAIVLAAEWPGAWPVERMRAALAVLQAAGMVHCDERRRVIWLPHFLRYNLPSNPNVVEGWYRDRDEVPECALRDQAIASAWPVIAARGERYAAAFRKAFPNHSKTIPEPFPNGSETIPEPFENDSKAIPRSEAQASARAGAQARADVFLADRSEHAPRAREVSTVEVDRSTTETAPAAEPAPAAPPAPSLVQRRQADDTARAALTTADAGALPTLRRNLGAAWQALREGLSVPHRLHRELLSKMATPDEHALIAWYGEIERRYDGQAIGEDVHTFWRARFQEWQGKARDPEAITLDTDPVALAARIDAMRAESRGRRR